MTHITSLTRATWLTKQAQASSCGPTTWTIYWFPFVKVSVGAGAEHYCRFPREKKGRAWCGCGGPLGLGPWEWWHIWARWGQNGERTALPVPSFSKWRNSGQGGKKDGRSSIAMEREWRDLAFTLGSSIHWEEPGPVSYHQIPQFPHVKNEGLEPDPHGYF